MAYVLANTTTKTCLNLTTYSRKPWNYNDTIIIEFDIMKKSSPLNLKFTFFVTKSSLTKILIDWGGLFHDINLNNNGVIVIPWFSTICG